MIVFFLHFHIFPSSSPSLFLSLCPPPNTEGGAKIDGTVQMPLKEAVQKYSPTEKPVIEHVRLDTQIDINEAFKECLNNLQAAKVQTAEAVEVLNALPLVLLSTCSRV